MWIKCQYNNRIHQICSECSPYINVIDGMMVKIFRAYKIEINLPNKIGMTFIFIILITVRVIVVPRI